MNPEFRRNLWLEATPFRLSLIAGILLLVFAAASTGPGLFSSQGAALTLYWFFAILWGTRASALSVVGEIRERTWDSQKLSAIGPIEMVWGKLFGATIHCWFGALVCLPFILQPIMRAQGLGPAMTYALILLLLGVFAQGVALLSSLVLIRRQTGNWRLDTFLCQVAGILAAFSFYRLWNSAAAFARSAGGTVAWWGQDFNLNAFHLVSLLLFTAWVLVGCWRAMRAELRFANGPFVWLAWLSYVALYQAGFASLLGNFGVTNDQAGAVAVKLSLGGAALLTSTYSMAFLEPKDPVRLRWLGEQLRAGRAYTAFLALDAWMLSLGATLVTGGLLVMLMLASHGTVGDMPLSAAAMPVLALLGFLVRDVAIFVLMRRFAGGKGDFAAVAVLAALYLLVPMILHGMHLNSLVALFLPSLHGGALGVLSAWAQGVAVAIWASHSIGTKLPGR